MKLAGWKLFCKEKKSEVEKDGFSGKKLVSKLGENWRGLGKEEKGRFQKRAYVIECLKFSPVKLKKSHSHYHKTKTLERQKTL